MNDVSVLLPCATESNGAIHIPPGMRLEQLERIAVEQELRRHGGNRTRAAESLGISVRTLQRKLKAWRIDRMRESKPPASVPHWPTQAP